MNPQTEVQAEHFTFLTPELGAGYGAEFLLLDLISIATSPKNHVVDLGRVQGQRYLCILIYLPVTLIQHLLGDSCFLMSIFFYLPRVP